MAEGASNTRCITALCKATGVKLTENTRALFIRRRFCRINNRSWASQRPFVSMAYEPKIPPSLRRITNVQSLGMVTPSYGAGKLVALGEPSPGC